MLAVRKAGERGRAEHGWLESYHTFSFADYYEPAHMGFRTLRVINEDRVQPSRGFGEHSHRDREIVSYVIAGALEHTDSMGTGSIIRPGDVQRMSAGRGVTHSEFNASADALVHFLQIWIIPENNGIEPSYEQKGFPMESRRGVLRLVASGDAREGSVRLQQDVDLYATLLEESESVSLDVRSGRGVWVQLVRGEIDANGVALSGGDGVAVSDETAMTIACRRSAEVLLFDLG
jgi:redox-sensitive bicupin YhaK (pirin superfamily)